MSERAIVAHVTYINRRGNAVAHKIIDNRGASRLYNSVDHPIHFLDRGEVFNVHRSVEVVDITYVPVDEHSVVETARELFERNKAREVATA